MAWQQPKSVMLYLNGKLFEWSFSWCLIILGTNILLSPTMLQGSVLRVIVKVVSTLSIDLVVVPLAFLMIGTLSIAALIANGGSMRLGPWIRAICALLRGVVWLTFSLSMLDVSIKQGFQSPMESFFPIFAATEGFIIYRAVLDVRDA
jgi:hypothetical protein